MSTRRSSWWRWPGSISWRAGRRPIADAQRRVDAMVERLSAPAPSCRRSTSTPAVRRKSRTDRISRRPNSSRPSKSASNTSAPATSFKSSSASGWNWRSSPHPFEIYRTLRVVNPSPFMFYLRTPSVTLVGSSPEIMVRVVDGRVTVRPLAGTRPPRPNRGRRPAAGRRTVGRSEGTGRARDAGRSGPQRRRPRGPLSLGRSDRRHDDRTLQPRDAHHVERHRPVGRRAKTLSTPCGLLAGRHRLRRSEGAGHANHRRTRAAPPRAVCRSGRLFRLRRQHGHLHRPAHDRRARATRPTSKPAPASSPTASRRANIRKR